MNHLARTTVSLLALATAVACAGQSGGGPMDFPLDGADGKSDVFGRKLAGVAAPYEASDLDEEVLQSDMKRRRQVAWATVGKVLEDVPLLGLAEAAEPGDEVELADGDVPRVPRFQTWYGIDDIKRMFQHLYEGLEPAGRSARVPFTAAQIDEAVRWNATALDRSKRWPLERYLRYVQELGVCPDDMPADECANLVQEKTGGAVSGNARILYSPATAEHILRNYGAVIDCLGGLDELGLDAQPTDEDNFTRCFDAEFPVNSVLVKAQWARAEFGKDMPVYDTDGDTLAARLAGTAHWGEAGDRRADPAANDIFTIRLRSGDVYRMVGLHIMTKELRHWQWITVWWSDRPDTDFGADRPAAVADAIGGVFSNYKMCAVDGFDEKDADPSARFGEAPSLAAALRATESGPGGPTWCSNPYLEHGRNNARTNCIGCHQHGGATVIRDADGDGRLDPLDLDELINNEEVFTNTSRDRIRDLFPGDYLYSINKVDDFAHMMSSEVSFFDNADRDLVRARIERVLALSGDADEGRTRFLTNCATCHGDTGEGSGWAPSLYQRVPNRDDASIVQTLIQGKGNMPSWGEHFDDQTLADLRAYLRSTFGGG